MGLTIGKISRLSGVPIDTIRFYEKNGLIPPPQRRDSGYRDYDRGTVSRLLFIKKAKELGFTLSEIREILDLRTLPGESCVQVQSLAEQKIRSVQDKIRSLEEIHLALKRLLEECHHHPSPSLCPILDYLEAPEKPHPA